MLGLTSMPDEDQKVDLPRVAGLSLLHGMPQWALVRIAQSATELSVPAGHVLVRQYDRATTVFVVLSRAVQILNRVGIGVLRGEGELVGWSTFRPPTATRRRCLRNVAESRPPWPSNTNSPVIR